MMINDRWADNSITTSWIFRITDCMQRIVIDGIPCYTKYFMETSVLSLGVYVSANHDPYMCLTLLGIILIIKFWEKYF